MVWVSTRVAGRRIAGAVAGRFELPPIANEKNLTFAPGSAERDAVLKECAEMRRTVVDIPCVVGGEEIRTSEVREQVIPSDHRHVLARFYLADKDVMARAVEAGRSVWPFWSSLPPEHRQSIFLRAADLAATKYRTKLLAATMLGQGKTVVQAEIDAAAELCDFWRFSAKYAQDIYDEQPPCHAPHVWNRVEYRALEGFIAAVSPFNFTAIGANLSGGPAIMGNVVLWKPSHASVYSNYVTLQILREAGLPDGVINFLPCSGPDFGSFLSSHPDLAGFAFTGSTKTFKTLWKQIASNIDACSTYPRIVGETGGKNFHMVHESADIDSVAAATLRAAFEYQGQKCSACSRMYVASTVWPALRDKLLAETAKIAMGEPDDMKSFMSAVIDKPSFDRIKRYIDGAKADPSVQLLAGGGCDESKGYFIQPTIFQTTNPKHTIMEEEIFGPVLAIYVYDAREFSKTLDLCNETSPYGLTGSIWALDRAAVVEAVDKLKHACGNLYINDRCTGSIVGQQPFGGARASGTNDKAGAASFLTRWVSPFTVKETLVPVTEWRYPSMA